MAFSRRNISFRMRGDDVALLHKNLLKLGYAIDGTELQSALFRKTTLTAVKDFQSKNDLNVTGVLDDATADALIRVVGGAGTQPDDEQPPSIPEKYEIRGMIRDDTGKGLAKQQVHLYEKLLREEKPLANTTSYRNGFYQITYQPTKLGNHYKKEFAVVVKILKEDGSEWMRSTPIFNPRQEEWVNFMEGGGEYKGDSEYEKVMEKILPLVDGVPLVELRENDEYKDITYLSGRTGFDTQEITMEVISHHLAAKTKIEPEVFYALFKRQLPKNLPESLLARTFKFTMIQQLVDSLLKGILALSGDTIKFTLLKAVEENVIPIRFSKRIDGIVKSLEDLRVSRILEQPNVVGKTSLGSLLGITGLKKENYALLAQIYDQYGGMNARFWKALEKESDRIGEAEISDIKLTLELGLRTKNHLPLLKTLKRSFTDGKYMYPRELAKLERSDWEGFIKASTSDTEKGYPSNIDSATEEDKIRTYAQELTERFERAYPTVAVARYIQPSELPALKHKNAVLKFLENNQSVNLKTLHMDQYLKQNKETALAGIEQPEVVVKEAKMVQRALQLAPDVPSAKALLELDMHSAQKIYSMGKSRFVQDTSSKMSKTTAEKIYANAELKHAVVLARLLEYNLDVNGVLPKAILPPVTPGIIKAKNIEQDFPSLKGLFGSLDFCDCEHCKSVYGPAAYLVDLMAFLKERRAKEAGKNVKDIMFKRRPDVGEIDLSCENTNTALPYIDLVNEILEDAIEPLEAYTIPAAVAPHLVGGKIKNELLTEVRNQGLQVSEEAVVSVIKEGEIWSIKDMNGYYKVHKLTSGDFRLKPSRQTLGTTMELKAHPAYVNAKAYDKLKLAMYPMSLPFDLWWEEARTYLGHLDIKRHQLMEAYQDRKSSPEIPNNKHIAAEYFGINAAEQQLICSSDQTNQSVYWGITGDPVQKLAKVSTFLKMSGFVEDQGKEYQRLLELLASHFVNPEPDASAIQMTEEGCDTEKQTITSLSADKLDRMHRFLRLWRKTGWKMWELDKLIRSPKLGNNFLDDNCLKKLKAFKELQEKLKLPAEQLIAFYELLNTELRQMASDGKKAMMVEEEQQQPLYSLLFLNKTVVNPLDPKFELNKVTNPATTEKLVDNLGPILAALTITEEEFQLLASKLTDDRLTLANLSFLYRNTLLARKLKLRVKELILLMQLITNTNDPFESVEKTNEFIKYYDELRKFKLTVLDLEYLLTPGEDSPLGMSHELVMQYVSQIRSNLQKAKDGLYNSATTLEENVKKSLSNFDQFSDPQDLQAAIDIISGKWTGSVSDRNTFIDTKFAGFISDLADAKTKLGNLTGTTDAQKEAEVTERYNYVLSNLYRHHARNIVTATISNLLKIEERHAKIALENIERAGHKLMEYFMDEDFLEKDPATGEYTKPLSDPAFTLLFESMHVLHKVSKLVEKLKIKPETLQWLILNHNKYGGYVQSAFTTGINFLEIPVKPGDTPLKFHSLLYMIQLLEFNARYPEQEGPLSILKILENLTNQSATFDDLSKWTGWDRDNIADTAAALRLQYPQDYRLLETYQRFLQCMQHTKKAGVKAVTLLDWINPTLSSAESDQIKQAVKAKYETEQWLNVSETLQNEIRGKKRAALVSYLVANPKDKVEGDPSKGKAWDDANGMFAYFLVDVEMSSCQLTSRIKQAAGSVQLFVQRCFLNLEPEVVVDAQLGDGSDTYYDEEWLQWKWMKNYRVWEANRKVFLYPENWIEPELRDDKSPFFKELENDLLQNEITMQHAEDVFLNYLGKLDEVSRLEVCGVYHEYRVNTDVLHVIARTRNTPHTYFHRERVKSAYWTPWKKIDLDIQSEHVMPIVYNRKLHLFWTVFTEKPEKDQPTPASELSGKPPPESRKYVEIQLAWSIYKNGRWSPEKISEAKLIHPWPRPSHSFSFSVWKDDFDVRVYIDMFVGTSKEFNDARILDKNGNATTEYKYPYLERHSEAIRPWHSSRFTFVSDDVEQVYIVDLRGWYNVVHNNYGEEGRAIAAMYSQHPARRLPAGLHYRHNQLVSNEWTVNNNLNSVVLNSALRNSERILTGIGNRFSVVTDIQANSFFPENAFFLQGIFNGVTRSYFIIPETRYTTHYDYLGRAYVTAGIYYTFHDFYHPYTTKLTRELNRIGISGVLNRNIQIKPESIYPANNFNFDTAYNPNKPYVSALNTTEVIDFSFGSAYGIYNWELFFHAPLLIASKLSQNRRFEDAMQWFHYIFDPTNPSEEETPKKYWITKPFYNHNSEDYRNQKIENLLKNVNARLSPYVQQVDEWRNNPFKPHLIARFRNVAYQWTVVMKYIDNLIAWGDQLFRRDTIESINEATQLYIVAAEILGPRPIMVPAGERIDKSFNEIEADLDAFSNVLEGYENLISVRSGSVASEDGKTSEKLPGVYTFYFCIPPNEKLLRYWDTVADRLLKIRHCMNIEGVVRQLPLFEPTIDPALLVKAAAAGVDIASVLNDIGAPLPNYRFNIMIQKAYEFCNYVKTLGSELLAALEKKDAEKLALLRSSHEIKVLEAIKLVRDQQIQQAKETKEGLEKTKVVIDERQKHYDNLIKSGLNAWEITQLALMGTSTGIDTGAAVAYSLVAVAKLFPQFIVGAAGAGGSPHADVETGGRNFGESAEAVGKGLSAIAQSLDKMASIASTVATYNRREDEWEFQRLLAEKELAQIDKQIEAAKLGMEITQKELSNTELQIENAKEADEYMHTKYTNFELYDWMITQISSVYFQAYQLAYDLAKRAEKTYQYEIAKYDTSFINFGAWDSLKKGLLAGEKLELDLRRMESAYLDQNKREYEITKHISLAQINPVALMALKANGTCVISLPEWLFDMDYPGHYMRRIKSVRISIPCVTGPYTGINCTLTLLKNSTRLSNLVGDDYPRDLAGSDDRFKDNLASIQSIATSDAQNDSGLFELSFRDERYLPFEGAGLISEWRINLPKESNYLDFNTISDVVIHIDYTAREAGEMLKTAAKGALQDILPGSGVQLFDLKNEFPTEWHRFLNPDGENDQELGITLQNEHFPFYTRNKTVEIKSIKILAEMNNDSGYSVIVSPPLQASDVLNLTKDGQFSGLHHVNKNAPSGVTYSIGEEWKFKMKKQGVTDYKSLQPDEVKNMVMILQFETTS
jgi:Tc toxin complex TcA C-terminal TcB-binding domain/Neuraminidase-like domain/Putative peptidoglycan binding domain/Salmonella virulence plasmid 28.1kDa A protein